MLIILLEILLISQIGSNSRFKTKKSFRTSTNNIQNEDIGIILDIHEMSLGDAYRFDTFLHNIIGKRIKKSPKLNIKKKTLRDASRNENNISQLELVNRLKSNR